MTINNYTKTQMDGNNIFKLVGYDAWKLENGIIISYYNYKYSIKEFTIRILTLAIGKKRKHPYKILALHFIVLMYPNLEPERLKRVVKYIISRRRR